MYEIKYQKDYRHNYLIIKGNGQEKGTNMYQIKMITQNTIKGLLPCRERHVNGDMLLFYEITSRQSLAACYEGRGIKMEVLQRFFLQLRQVNDLLQKYLLEESGLWLSPEYIFCNIETGEFSFLFYPEPLEDGFLRLMDFFTENVDNEDLKAVEIVYKIADMVRGEQFVTDEILSWFQYDYSDEPEINTRETDMRRSSLADPRDGGYEQEPEESSPGDRSCTTVPLPKPDLKKAGILAAAEAAGAGILAYIGCTYTLSGQERIFWIAGWAGIAISCLAAVFFLLLPFVKARGRQEIPVSGEEEKKGYIRTCEAAAPEKEEEMGNTVFLPWTENTENKLYAMDRKNKCHIDLSRLPLTVGKMAGAVDLVINDQSLSRMHARFFREGNRIRISDLNSTNGTFKNGMRLDPNASEIIEPGDEIRLGRLKFIYR